MSLSAPGLEFRVLGPLEVASGAERLAVGGSRQQVVLATLLLSPNEVVSTGRLLEAVYGERPPLTSRSQVHNAVAALRRLFAARCGSPVVTTHADGYAIVTDRSQVDAARFAELAAAARDARDDGRLADAVARYRSALRLWRGPAFDGIASRLVQAAGHRLDEQRLAASEDRVDLELQLGRHAEMTGILAELIAEHPLRERLHGLLMIALYRCGRTADALGAYRQARRVMIDELGVEPGEWLRQLEHEILTAGQDLDLPARPGPGPAARRPPGRAAPCLLPAAISDFTGRAGQLEAIARHLLPADGDEARLAVPIVVIPGKGGAGKTAIAVQAAHRIAARYPGGQLFVDLGGTSARPVSPAQVLGRFLRALGMPGPQIPDALDERAEAYRSQIANRAVLVLLDDAASERQVLPLLPGRATAAVIVTSRSRLAGLPGACPVEVDVLDAGVSLELLARIIGARRTQAEPGAAARIADLCGHLPLALRIASARLLARPHWSLDQLVHRLADETRRLDELRHGDLAFRASISLSYASTDAHARRLFRLLALLDVPAFPGWAAAALLGQPLARAQDALDTLVGAQLIEPAGASSGLDSQYRFHDLARVFARERLAAEDSPAGRRAALARYAARRGPLRPRAGSEIPA